MGRGSSKLKPEELTELHRKTHFEKKELQQWYRSFMSDYSSGVMKVEDFKKIYRDYYPFGDTDDFAERLFYMCDGNKDGEVDFKEFIDSLSIASRAPISNKLTWAFLLYSGNKEVIERESMLEVMKSLYHVVDNIVEWPEDENTPEKRVDKLFNLMDLDNDGEINMLNFMEGAQKDPSIVDMLNLYTGIL